MRLGVQSWNIRVAKIMGLAFRDLQGGEFGGPVVGKLVKLFGETRTVIGGGGTKVRRPFLRLRATPVLWRGRRRPQTGAEGLGGRR